MATAILRALRQRRDLRGTTFHTAKELAHSANAEGLAEISYDQLAYKIRMSPRTAKRHVKRIIQDAVIERLPHVLSAVEVAGQTIYRYAINTYRFLIPFDRTERPAFSSARLFTCATWSFFAWLLDKMAQILPNPTPIRMKNLGLVEELHRQEKGLRLLTPGSQFYQRTQEEIARLKALLEAPCTA